MAQADLHTHTHTLSLVESLAMGVALVTTQVEVVLHGND